MFRCKNRTEERNFGCPAPSQNPSMLFNRQDGARLTQRPSVALENCVTPGARLQAHAGGPYPKLFGMLACQHNCHAPLFALARARACVHTSHVITHSIAPPLRYLSTALPISLRDSTPAMCSLIRSLLPPLRYLSTALLISLRRDFAPAICSLTRSPIPHSGI